MCPHGNVLCNSCTVQLYVGKLHAVNRCILPTVNTWPTVRWSHHYRWPTIAQGKVTDSQQLCMGSSCTWSCYTCCTRSCYTLPTVTTTLHGASSQHMVKLCMGSSYMWPAVTRGLVMYGQWFHSANNNITLQQQRLAARGVLRGVLKGLGRVLDLCGEP